MKNDKQIQQDVMAELNWEPSVNAAHIGVEVSDGVVTLAGHVSNYAEKLNAERAHPARRRRQGADRRDGRYANAREPPLLDLSA